jgi:phosphorylcholine metabolism protein LicD
MNYLEKIKRHNIDKKYLIEKITQDDALKNLCYFINLIQDFEYFIFFGTLLGLTRENNIIDGDDDIDFYVNEKHRDNLIEILKSNSIEVNKTLHTNRDKSFLQVVRIHNNKAYLIDFYFYDGDTDEDYIIEKWNYQGMPHIPSKHLKIPKIFIYPLQNKTFNNFNINFPSKPKILCEFLYGPEWKKKINKDTEYTVKVINNKPVYFRIKKSFFGRKKLVELEDL